MISRGRCASFSYPGPRGSSATGLDYLRLDKTKTKHYCFDHSFGPDCGQGEVYEKTAKVLVPKVVEGYNGCCFAYGASATRCLRRGRSAYPLPPRAISSLGTNP